MSSRTRIGEWCRYATSVVSISRFMLNWIGKLKSRLACEIKKHYQKKEFLTSIFLCTLQLLSSPRVYCGRNYCQQRIWDMTYRREHVSPLVSMTCQPSFSLAPAYGYVNNTIYFRASPTFLSVGQSRTWCC